MHHALRQVDRVIAAAEQLVLVVFVAVIVALPLGQIALRMGGWGGFPWGHEVVRHLLLWVAFLGASLATAERRHITIDLLDRSLSPRAKAAFNVVVEVLGVVVIGYLARVAFTFVGIQMEMGGATAILRVPMWVTKLILPIALSVMTWRLVLLVLEDLDGLRRSDFAYLGGPDAGGRLY